MAPAPRKGFNYAPQEGRVYALFHEGVDDFVHDFTSARIGGQHNDWYARFLLFYERGNGYAVHSRHGVIDDNCVYGLRRKDLQALFAVGCRSYFKPRFLEKQFTDQ